VGLHPIHRRAPRVVVGLGPNAHGKSAEGSAPCVFWQELQGHKRSPSHRGGSGGAWEGRAGWCSAWTARGRTHCRGVPKVVKRRKPRGGICLRWAWCTPTGSWPSAPPKRDLLRHLAQQAEPRTRPKRSPSPFFMLLFTQVPRRRILRTSPVRSSRKSIGPWDECTNVSSKHLLLVWTTAAVM
jgi:hypothetical protein